MDSSHSEVSHCDKWKVNAALNSLVEAFKKDTVIEMMGQPIENITHIYQLFYYCELYIFTTLQIFPVLVEVNFSNPEGFMTFKMFKFVFINE